MQTSVERWAQGVLPHYKFRVLGRKQVLNRQDEIVFDTDQGEKLVKIYQDVNEFRLDYAVSEYIATHGFRRLPRLIRTIYGDPCIFFEETWFGFTDEMEGRPLQFTPEDVLPFARTLALIHQAVQGFPLEDSIAVKTWRDVMLTSVNDVKQSFDEWGKSPKRDPFQNLFMQHADGYAVHARKVLQVFESRSDLTTTRCLGNVRFDDYRIGSNGKVYMRTIPRPYADTPVYDLAKLCLFALDQGHPDAIPDILREYRTVAVINDQEHEQIKTYLSFPHSDWKLFYLYRRKRGTPEQLAALLQKEQEKNRERESWIQSLFPVSQ
jgi:hypothetical protein